jgi:type II secretory pathway component GspD/PulD (secretin)
VVAVPATRQVLVTETAGRLRAIRQMLDRIERPTGTAAGQVRIFDLRQSNPQSVLDVLRQLLDIPADRFAVTDGSIHFTLDGSSSRLVVSGKPEKLTRVEEILRAIDVHEVTEPVAGRINEAPQLEVYPITAADAESVLRVIQTLLAGIPDVRLALDPKTGNMIAMARPSQQATIRATLDQLQRESRQVEVITLFRLDPQSAVASITKLFPADSGAPAPQIDADPTTRQLLIRATPVQLQQIRGLLEKMGEPSLQKSEAMASGNIRTLPLTGRGARSALERIQDLWPTVRKNKIRVVTPSSAIPTVRAGQEGASAMEQLLDLMQRGNRVRENQSRPAPATPSPTPPADNPKPQSTPPGKSASAAGLSVRFASQATAKPVEEQPSAEEPPPIIVVPGPGGLLIASEDIEALNQFEHLLNTLATGMSSSAAEMTIFYLKYAKAAVMAETLSQILSGASSSSESSSGGGPPMGGPPGGPPGPEASMASALLSIGGSIATSGSVKITSDARLNALVVQAVPADLDTIEQLLKILDQKESPEEIPAAAKPRIIPVQNLPANSIAEIIRQLYADRMITANPSTQNAFGGGPFPGPMGSLAMMFGGGGGGRSGSSRRSGRGSQQDDENVQRLSVGVDSRANSLIVLAPDPLFEEVRQLVEHLDADALKSNQRMEVVTLKRTNLSAVQQALTAMLGESVQASSTSTPSSGYSGSGRFMMPGGFGGFPMGGFGPPGGFGSSGGDSSGGYYGSRRSRYSGESSSGSPSSRSGGRGR